MGRKKEASKPSKNGITKIAPINKLLYVLATLELFVFLLGLPWLFTNSLAVALAGIVWMALVPLILISAIASLWVVKRIDSTGSLLRIIVLFNWLALVFLIVNVTD